MQDHGCSLAGAVAIVLRVQHCRALAALQDTARLLLQLFLNCSAADGPVQAGCCKNAAMPVLFCRAGRVLFGIHGLLHCKCNLVGHFRCWRGGSMS
jgi:hypothetical protein